MEEIGPSNRRPNHLAGQTSPYLLQHLYNPVDWYPWGPEALQRSRDEQRPIFLSIGYAACHWCHVMERESFEDPQVAEMLNRAFVPIKVDREERPDIDEIYMNAVQIMTGQGGWPLNTFLTPQLEPFFGGTYFPPEQSHGRIGFKELLQRIDSAWRERPDELQRSATEMTRQLQRIAGAAVGEEPPVTAATEHLSRAVADLAARFDPDWGGFGNAPKFPQEGALALMFREQARSGEALPLQMAQKTLDAMASGGMYDQVGGGFARYSVDERWLVPHFEKMLYNQALLVPVYLDAWLLTRKPLYRRVVEETLDFVRREMTASQGGFYSSLDADSEGEEGKFYVWSLAEVEQILGPEDSELFGLVYGLTREGNFEGRKIPHLHRGSLERQAETMGCSEQDLVQRLAALRSHLLESRERRVRPATDDKILGAWNGLMITAFARAHQVLGRADDLHSARAAADFLVGRLLVDGRLRVSFREDRAQLNGYLDDYAFVGRGLLDLYETSFDERDLRTAETLAGTMLRHFEDPQHGGFFFTSDDHESLLTRNRSSHDGALPAGAGVATEMLLRLGIHLNRPQFLESAHRTLATHGPIVGRSPAAYAALVLADDTALRPAGEIAVLGDPGGRDTRELLDVIRQRYGRQPVIQCARSSVDNLTAVLAGKQALQERPTVFVCREYACQRPTSDPGELERLLDQQKG